MTANYFELEHLSHVYADGTKALIDISLHIPKGKKSLYSGKMAQESQHYFSILMAS